GGHSASRCRGTRADGGCRGPRSSAACARERRASARARRSTTRSAGLAVLGERAFCAPGRRGRVFGRERAVPSPLRLPFGGSSLAKRRFRGGELILGASVHTMAGRKRRILTQRARLHWTDGAPSCPRPHNGWLDHALLEPWIDTIDVSMRVQ